MTEIRPPAVWPFPRAEIPPIPERAGEWVSRLERIRELRNRCYDRAQRGDAAGAARAAIELCTTARELELVLMSIANKEKP